jgi:3D (Asp-Asp-Asp) domain-containing protein
MLPARSLLTALLLAAPLLMLAGCSAAPADDGESSADALSSGASVTEGQTLTTTSRVNIREGASTSDAVIDTLDVGVTVTALEDGPPTNGFYHVDADGQEGWVYGAYLRASGSSGGSTGGGSTGGGSTGGGSTGGGTVSSSFTARGTGYYPDSSALEGGFVDRVGKPLHTLQQFLAGQADYVSVAMDTRAFNYGQRLKIHELETKYGKAIPFRVVDTGGAFTGKGRTRIDICTANNRASLDPTINGQLHIDVIDETSSGGGTGTTQPPPAPPPPPPSGGGADPGADPGSDPGADPGAGGGGSGATCTTHGDCNPGSDGSGMICKNGQCVEGCTASWQCPGSTTCSGGHCR